MPLLFPPAPAAALRCVLAALSSPTAVREARTPALRETSAPLTPERPLPMHVLDTTAAAADNGGLPGARLTGWRFHIRAGDQVAAAGEAMPTPDGWVFDHFCEGPYLVSTERALRQAELLPVPYQPHLLSVPGLYMFTLWLHGDPSADAGSAEPAPTDLLIPLAPAPPGIAAHRMHRMADLVPVLTMRLAPPGPLLGTRAS
jgi:hypothetical protein